MVVQGGKISASFGYDFMRLGLFGLWVAFSSERWPVKLIQRCLSRQDKGGFPQNFRVYRKQAQS